MIDLIAKIGLGDKERRSKDILGRVYEYFLSQFASADGKKGGQFYTPRCVVQLLVEMLLPAPGYGKTPDKQEKATATVLQQAELLCADWAS